MEEVECGHEKRATAAGGVQNFDTAQPLLIIEPEPPLGLLALFRERDGHRFQPGRVVELRELHIQPRPHCLSHDEARHELGCVKDAMLFPLRDCWRVTALDLGVERFEIGYGLLEDTAQDIDVEVGVEVIGREHLEVVQGRIGHFERDEVRFAGEKASVVSVDLEIASPFIDGAKQALELCPSGCVNETRPGGFQGAAENVRREQAGVLAKADKENAVQEGLDLAEDSLLVDRDRDSLRMYGQET